MDETIRAYIVTFREARCFEAGSDIPVKAGVRRIAKLIAYRDFMEHRAIVWAFTAEDVVVQFRTGWLGWKKWEKDAQCRLLSIVPCSKDELNLAIDQGQLVDTEIQLYAPLIFVQSKQLPTET